MIERQRNADDMGMPGPPVMNKIVYIGWDPREQQAFEVARSSLRKHLTQPIPVRGLVLQKLINDDLYTRPFKFYHAGPKFSPAQRNVMWDILSKAPMSTQHANARFLVPHLAGSGWAMFTDGDVLFRASIGHLFDSLSTHYAVYCVKHNHVPNTDVKMDGQVQTQYSRKNWSSVMVFNCNHPANKRLTLDMINSLPGRDLHRFCWLEDDEIGELTPEWNYLVGYTKNVDNPKIVHFTEGTPDMPGYEKCEYADEWYAELMRHVA